MNWYDLPDNEFDSLFKKASKSSDFPYREEAWQNMERRLNHWEIFSSIYWRLLNGAVVLLVVVGSILLYNYSQTYQNKWDAGSPVISKNDIRNISLFADASMVTSEIQNPNDEDESSTKSGLRDSGTPIQNGKTTGNTQRLLSTVDSGNERAGSDTGSQVVRIEDQKGASDSETFTVITDEDKAGINTYSNVAQEYDFQELKTRTIPGSYQFSAPVAPERNKETNEIIPYRSKMDKKIALTLSVGPDFSGIPGAGFGGGTFAGLGLEIQLLNRLSILAGINHSRKKYAVSEGYEVPYNTYGSYVSPPDKVNIACHVIDIPVNLYYSFINTDKNRFFAGAGISSYLMLTEEYQFDYGYYSNPDLIREYTIKNENQHFLGVLNFSAGYTRNINDKWAWQIEPYYKLPVQDIAAAQVRLNSYGALFTLKYWFR